MKITVRTARPRNPFAPLARRRAGGRHAGGDRRQDERRMLQRELARLWPQT